MWFWVLIFFTTAWNLHKFDWLVQKYMYIVWKWFYYVTTVCNTFLIDYFICLICRILDERLEGQQGSENSSNMGCSRKVALKDSLSTLPLFYLTIINSTWGEAKWAVNPWPLRAKGLIVLVSPNYGCSQTEKAIMKLANARYLGKKQKKTANFATRWLLLLVP